MHPPRPQARGFCWRIYIIPLTSHLSTSHLQLTNRNFVRPPKHRPAPVHSTNTIPGSMCCRVHPSRHRGRDACIPTRGVQLSSDGGPLQSYNIANLAVLQQARGLPSGLPRGDQGKSGEAEMAAAHLSVHRADNTGQLEIGASAHCEIRFRPAPYSLYGHQALGH